MIMKIFFTRLAKHPLGALYGVLLGIIAFFAALPMFASGMWDAAVVDLTMAGVLIALMLKTFVSTFRKPSTFFDKCAAWVLLILTNILALQPTNDFPGSLMTAFAASLLISAFVLYFSGKFMAAVCAVPALWCCIFMPYHEEFMLLLSFPLRLSATMFSAFILKIFGTGVVYSGTSLTLPDLALAITDACSGINQLDAFILIAFIAVEMLHKKNLWKILHFAFIIPSMIIGNSLRIVVTVMLFKLLGECVLQNSWHVALGYLQILLALVIFLAVGRIFRMDDKKTKEDR
jgi:exosortase/archaeosortase family protein